MVDHNLSDMRKTVGDLENALAINSKILLTKKVIYNSMKKDKTTHIINVMYEVKNFYNQEKYRYYIKGKKQQFEKQYYSLCNYYATKD